MDFQRFDLDKLCAIEIIDQNIMLSSKEHNIAETLFELYIKESIKYRLVLQAFLQTYKSLNEFALTESISYPIAHKSQSELNKELQKLGFKINRRFQVEAENEVELRFWATELLLKIEKHNFLIYEKSDDFFINNQQKKLHFVNTTLFQKLHIKHTLFVIDTRIRHHYFIENDCEFEIIDNKLLPKELINTSRLFLERFQLSENILWNEIYALSRYYFSLESLTYPLELPSTFTISRWNSSFISALQKKFPRIWNYPEETNQLYKEIFYVHIDLLNKGKIHNYFINAEQVEYFKNRFPEIHAFLTIYISNLKETEPFLHDRRKYLFLNYMMTIITVLPLEAILDPVYIYIDFSQGRFYNHFIETLVTNFANIGAIVTPVVDRADIVITDSRRIATNIDKEFVFLLNLPQATDLEFLFQKIVDTRWWKKHESQSELR
jgi:hypothetical protein